MGQKLTRPSGLSLIAVLWLIFGLVNVYFSFQTVSFDLEVLPYLFGPLMSHPWFDFGVIAELIIAFFVVALGFVQLITVPGLWMGKSYSYKLALTVPILLLIANVSSAGLYASAPAELDLGYNVGIAMVTAVMSMSWVIVYWQYLRRDYVKNYLLIKELPPTIQEKPMSPKEEKVVEKEAKFYCRYCGAENKSDAVFCEKCGKKVK